MTSVSDSDSFRSEDGRVEVVIDRDGVSESQISLIMRAAVTALDAERTEGPERITVMITGDEQIRELNLKFMGEDEVTDVLSFNAEGDEIAGGGHGNAGSDSGKWPEFVDVGDSPDVETGRLGDIAISLPQVTRQADENGKSVDRELAMLTVHGVLHLLGYDHADAEDEKAMFGKTDLILADVFDV